MRKSDIYRQINRNMDYDDAGRETTSHVFASDIYVNALWTQDDNRPSGVHIVELKSSESEHSVNNDRDDAEAQWQKTEDDDEYNPLTSDDFNNITVDDFKVNEAARAQRRVRNQQIADQYAEEMNKYQEYLYQELTEAGASEMSEENANYDQAKHFSILNKHFLASDSSDEGDDIEVINCGDADWDQDPNDYDSEMISYNPDFENEKRTVWIYSFKNKRLLTDNDFELVNIPSQDASTISSAEMEDFQEAKTTCPKIKRAATPMPPLHIPKLNLVNLVSQPTLPTLSEVTEPKTSPKGEKCEYKQRMNVKANNWFLSEHVTPTSEKNTNFNNDNSNSIINWMALSPREKRRRFKNASPIKLDTKHLPTLKEVSSVIEKNGEIVCTEQHDCGDSLKNNSKILKVKNDQATNTIESLCPFSNRSRKSVIEQMGSALVDSARKSVKTLRSNLSSAIGSLATVRENSKVEVALEETNNNEVSKESNPKGARPRIQISTKKTVEGITDPLENLDSNNWINEEKLIKNDDDIRYPVDGEGDRASDALWIKNMALLKPAEWTEYLPIAESIPSLQLSMNTDSVEDRPTCFKRFCKLFCCQ